MLLVLDRLNSIKAGHHILEVLFLNEALLVLQDLYFLLLAGPPEDLLECETLDFVEVKVVHRWDGEELALGILVNVEIQ